MRRTHGRTYNLDLGRESQWSFATECATSGCHFNTANQTCTGPQDNHWCNAFPMGIGNMNRTLATCQRTNQGMACSVCATPLNEILEGSGWGLTAGGNPNSDMWLPPRDAYNSAGRCLRRNLAGVALAFSAMKGVDSYNDIRHTFSGSQKMMRGIVGGRVTNETSGYVSFDSCILCV